MRFLRDRGYELVQAPANVSEEDLIRLVPGKDALIVGVEKITERVIQAADRLRIICKHGAGVDNIDVAAATRAGIPVTNVPGANSDAVADLAFGLMLAAARSIPRADRAVRAGEWPLLLGTEVWRKTLGIIGTGRIGKQVARRARGFEMQILGYDPHPDPAFAEEIGMTYVPLEELLRRSDFVTIHVPLTHATRGLIGRREIALMKPEAFLFNLSRGSAVDEVALYEALASGRLAGAGLDVFAVEPPGKENPLMQLENVIVTPHMGAYTREAVLAVGMQTVQNIHRVFCGERPLNVVNLEVLEA